MDLNRRQFLAVLAATAAGGRIGEAAEREGIVVNDVHAGLSRTTVSDIAMPRTTDDLAEAMRQPSSVCGGRYTSGGQPFLTDQRLIDLQHFSGVLHVDREHGHLTALAGTRWPILVEHLNRHAPEWAIRQKQSGADAVSLAGTVSVNAHGRCLAAPPIVADVQSLQLLDPDGRLTRCDRANDAERFRRVVGGYGLFGTIATVTLRLVPRVKLRRIVRWVATGDAVRLFDEAAAAGATYGDFQLNVDDTADAFLREGLLLTYEPADAAEPITRPPPDLRRFQQFATLAHLDKPRAWAAYRQQLLDAVPPVDWSDAWQAAEYVPSYHATVDAATGAGVRGSEVLSEFYVPRDQLAGFLTDTAAAIRQTQANMIYGNVRLIEPDTETALPWATGPSACVVMNLHVDHNEAGLATVRSAFRAVLDAALARGGSYYLAYHRFARPDQVLAAYPQLPGLLRNADGPCRSDWYRHYAAVFA